MAISIKFFHGRKDPKEELNDWGTEGPEYVIGSFQWTYNTTLRLFDTDGNDIWLDVVGDVIKVGDTYYGDFTIQEASETAVPLSQ